jgi:hypothetical protein
LAWLRLDGAAGGHGGFCIYAAAILRPIGRTPKGTR